MKGGKYDFILYINPLENLEIVKCQCFWNELYLKSELNVMFLIHNSAVHMQRDRDERILV